MMLFKRGCRFTPDAYCAIADGKDGSQLIHKYCFQLKYGLFANKRTYYRHFF